MNRKIILGASAASGTKGSTYLGRSWGEYARTIFQNSDLGNIITAAGWDSILFFILNLQSKLTEDRHDR